jgi:hypothetical protein
MAYQQITGRGLWMPQPDFCAATPTYRTDSLIDATGEKAAFAGRVWFPARTGTKNIQRVCFRWGAITKAGGSALTISLQDVSLTTGPPIQPDGVQDQTVAVANADANFASNTWYRSGTLSATRPVSCGDLLSVVIEYDGSGRLGSDAVIVNSMNNSGTLANLTNAGTLLNTSSTWATLAGLPIIVLEMDDGTFGTLEGSYVASVVTQNTFASNTAGADEYAAVVNFPFPCKIDALWASIGQNTGADCELLLYSGTSALVTITLDANAVSTATQHFYWSPIAETTLAANTDYYVSVRPTTTTAVTVPSIDVADANHFTLLDGGTPFQYTTRVDQGAWAAKTATRRLFAGVRLSSLDDGTGTSGMLYMPNLDGV